MVLASLLKEGKNYDLLVEMLPKFAFFAVLADDMSQNNTRFEEDECPSHIDIFVPLLDRVPYTFILYNVFHLLLTQIDPCTMTTSRA